MLSRVLERRSGRGDDEIADADRWRLLPAEQDDLGQLLGGHEIGVAEPRAVLLEADVHAGMDVGPDIARRDVDDAYAIICLRLAQRLAERADSVFAGRI